MSKWISPYQHLPREKIHRVNIDVDVSDLNLIRSIVPRHGFITTFLASFVKDIATYARSNSLSYESSDELESYIRRRAVASTPDDAGSRDDRGTTTRSDDTVKTSTHKSTGSKKRTSRRGRE